MCRWELREGVRLFCEEGPPRDRRWGGVRDEAQPKGYLHLQSPELLFAGAKALKGFKLDDVLAGLKTNLSDLSSGLSTSLRGIDLDVDVELPGTNRGDVDTPGGNPGIIDDNPATGRGDDGRATDNVNRDVDISNEHPRSEQPTNTHQSETPTQQPVVDLVREHELVGAGATGSPSTHHGGGGTQLIDNGGSSHSGSGGGGGHGSGGHGTGGYGGSGDGTPGGSGDQSPGGTGDGSGGGANHPGDNRPGGPHSDNTPNSPLGNEVARQAHYEAVLTGRLADLNISRTRFDELIETPFEKLTKSELDALIDVRKSLPEVTPGTVLQKIIPPSDVHRLFNDLLEQVARADLSTPEGAALVSKFDDLKFQDFLNSNHEIFDGPAGKYPVSSVGGFVSRSADVSDLNTSGLFDSLGLGYTKTEFSPTGQDYFAIQFEAGDLQPSRADYTLQAARTHFNDLDGLTGYDYQTALAEFVEQDYRAAQPQGPLTQPIDVEFNGRADWALNAVDEHNVHRGNGFGGQNGAKTPEFQLFTRVDIPDGAELWKISPAGERFTIATYSQQLGAWTLNP